MSNKKLVIAVLQESDYDTAVSELNNKHIFVTKLSSSGGFLKKKNVTIMIGVEEEQLSTVKEILKECAGRRKEVVYTMTTPGSHYAGSVPAVPIQVDTGGATVFVMDMDSLEKF